MRGERSMRSNSPMFGGDGVAAAEDTEGVKAGLSKRGLSGGEKMPSLLGRSMKRTHHHRRSPSTACSSSASGTRALRQSVSFPGGTNPVRRVEDAASSCLDSSVQVLIRARPVSGTEIASRCVRQENAQTISWLGQPETRFTFDHVAGEFVTQDEVFRMAGLPMVDNCMVGYNSCMFAYGQTGSGKTHTMLGDVADFENRGMTPRVFEYLFAKIRKEEETQKQSNLRYKCRCSFLEVYNEQIADLLEPASINLQMREDSKKGVFVEGLLEVEVRNVGDVLHLLLLGAANRKVAATNMNRESSRSHSVFTCVIESQWECDSMVNFRFGRLNLVDLAGSERQKDTGADEERLREAAGINKSLSTLGLVIMVLVDIANGKHRHVPYRDSKLTFLLQDSLGGNSKTTIIANISPSSCASSETLSTLKFAQRAKFIQNNAVINEELASGDVKGLQEKIHQLKDELARVRRQSVSPGPERKDASVSTDDAIGDWSPREGSFLQFGRGAVPIPTVLNHKVKQQEDESYLHKAKSPQLSREQENRSEECNADKRSILQACEKTETMMVRKKHEALLAELAAERRIAEHFRNEVESHERSLSECRTKVQTSLESNERIASELDGVRLEIEGLNEECRKHERDLATFRLKKALEINCLELKQAQLHNVVLELKTQLQQSEEKAEQENFRRKEIEVLLQEARQESTNLQTELQWTRDSLEVAEAAMENFQDLAHSPKHEISSPEDPCYAKEERKIKHQEAILQLQMELASIDSPEGSKWEKSPGAIDIETLEGERPKLREEKVSADQLQEHDITAQDSLQEQQLHATPSDNMKLLEVSELMLQREQALVEAEQQCTLSGAARLKLEEDYLDLQQQNKTTEEEILRLKEQRAPDRSNWVSLEKPDLQVALREPEDCFEEENQVKIMLERLNNSENETVEERQLETQDCSILKAMVLNLDKENADLQHQLLETEAGSTALRYTIANLQRELQERSEEVGTLTTQLHVSDRHIFSLKCESVELRGAMQRQAVAFEEEKAYRKKAERYKARSRKLKSQVENLQLELENLQLLRDEMAEELHTSRGMNIQLQDEVKRKQRVIEALEEHLLNSEQSKLQFQEELQRCVFKAEEKQVEAEILGKTVEELETTVYALESQVGLLKRQCSERETMERELQELRQQNVNLLAALSPKISARAENEASTERNHEGEIDSAGIQRQTCTQRKMSLSQPKDVPKARRSLGSAFRWLKTNHGQVHSELDEERKAHERHVQELENALGKRQLEVIALQEKLADAERVARDVLLVLSGVKVDMANAADEDVGGMLTQLNNFIEERESWMEIISGKQADLIAAHTSVEKLREREKALVAENEKFKNENQMQVKRIGQLEQEARNVSGQQTRHYVKIKDDNNALRIQNSELSAKLRRVEHANTRISAELAKYRIAQGRPPLVNIEEEQRLRTKLQKAQKQSSEAVTELASFSARVIKATGMNFDCSIDAGSLAVGLEAIEQLRIRFETVQLELDDFKLKTKIVEEKQRLRDMTKATRDSPPTSGIDSHLVKPR